MSCINISYLRLLSILYVECPDLLWLKSNPRETELVFWVQEDRVDSQLCFAAGVFLLFPLEMSLLQLIWDSAEVHFSDVDVGQLASLSNCEVKAIGKSSHIEILSLVWVLLNLGQCSWCLPVPDLGHRQEPCDSDLSFVVKPVSHVVEPNLDFVRPQRLNIESQFAIIQDLGFTKLINLLFLELLLRIADVLH